MAAEPSGVLRERAPAKINLSLHVLGRRSDGYHALDSLVAFAAVADELTLEPGPGLALTVRGPTAAASGVADDNLVLRAARALLDRAPGLRSGHFRLLKRLPVAAGIGGGSADAAAALRLLARANGLDSADPRLLAAARETGADVPVCLDPRPRIMRGAGEHVSAPLVLPRLPALLVNPGVETPTAAVFGALGLAAGTTLAVARTDWPAGGAKAAFVAALAAARNDLETPAIAVTPAVREAIAAVAASGSCRLARMSGSGATVFGLFDTCRHAAAAAKAIRTQNPGWWVRPTMIG